MSELTNVFARNMRDLTTPTSTGVNPNTFDNAKIPIGNAPKGFESTEALTVKQIKDLATGDLESKKANKTDVEVALSNLSTTANKFYPTLSEANSHLATMSVNAVVTIGEEANKGLWYKATAGATTLTKSAYDPLTQANNYTNNKAITTKTEAVAIANNYTDLVFDAVPAVIAPYVAQAEAAATAATISAGVFETPEAGVDPTTGVEDGEYFNVRSPSSDSYIDEYQNIGGVATPSGKSYPSGAYVQNIVKYIARPFVEGKTYSLNERVQLTNGDIVKSTIANNTVNPNIDMTGWVKANDVDQIKEGNKTQKQINNSKSITYLLDVNLFEGLTVRTTSYHPDLKAGGNTFVYKSDVPRDTHNGGTVIDPSKIFPTDWTNKTQQLDWFTASNTGNGCFVVENPQTVYASQFGVRSDLDSCKAIQAALNFSQYRTPIIADLRINTTETLNVVTGMGLATQYYVHNNRNTLASSVIDYHGTGSAVRFIGISTSAPRSITFFDIQVNDADNTGSIGVEAPFLIGSQLQFSTYGFDRGVLNTGEAYYCTAANISCFEYRKSGFIGGGAYNNVDLNVTCVSSQTTVETGFQLGVTDVALGMTGRGSNNPRLRISVEQAGGRAYDIQQVFGGELHIYQESPYDVAYTNIQMNFVRCFGVTINAYGSLKSGYGAYFNNSRDCSISGKLKGATTADVFASTTCVGIDTSNLQCGIAVMSNFTSGHVEGFSTASGKVRVAVGNGGATLPALGDFGVGSRLKLVNSLVQANGSYIAEKLITTAGNFGTLTGVTATGVTGSDIITINSGSNQIFDGDYLAITGTSGSRRITRIYEEDGVTKAKLSGTLSADITSSAISYYAPVAVEIVVNRKMASQADSTATDVAGIVAAHNALLAKLREEGFMN